MAHENSVSFKCYLQGEGVNEVRRFGVDKDVVCNFNYLKGKLQTVFPSLQGKEILVAWIGKCLEYLSPLMKTVNYLLLII